ncbi:MAG: hypothetical protein DRH03_07890 [Deltaproteobacteria bacterium]|nr:MAG: hypothetical protein DRH03_07890 [Deltaproteobacteria bacterium]
MASVAGFLGYVNYRDPFLGKSLDYLLGVELKGGVLLEIGMPEGAVVSRHVAAGRVRLGTYASAFWGQDIKVEVVTRPSTGRELRIFAVDNSKLWNQIVFFLQLDSAGCQDLPAAGVVALVIGKKEYQLLQKRFTPATGRDELEQLLAELDSEFFQASDLAAMVDRVVPRAQKRLGIVHLVSLCKSEREFLALDYTCARIKESGTPGHEGPLQVRSLLGRLHAVFPGQYCAGLSIVHMLAS